MTDAPPTLRYAPHAAVLSAGYVVFSYAAVPRELMAALDIGFAAFGLLMSAALLSFVLVQPVASRLVESTSTTRVLLAATVAHALLAVALDFAGTFATILALRLCWGAAGGLVLSVGATHIARLYDGGAATFQQGVYGGLLTLGGAVGFLLAPRLLATTGGAGLYGFGAVLALPAVGMLWHHRDDRRTEPDRETADRDASAFAVATDRTVVLASVCYVAVIGSYITISTFVTSYFEGLGVVGSANAAVLLLATIGRASGGVAVGRGAVGDARLIGGASLLGTVGLAALAAGVGSGTGVGGGVGASLGAGTGTTLVVALPLVVMFAVSVPFGAVYNVAADATASEGAAIATVVAVGNVAALVLPAVTGTIRDSTGEYGGGFALLAALNLAAAAAAAALGTRTDGQTENS